jgi:hypothetical protein
VEPDAGEQVAQVVADHAQEVILMGDRVVGGPALCQQITAGLLPLER